MLPQLDSTEALKAAATAERDAIANASMLLALARLAPEALPSEEPDDPLRRGALSLARLRADRTRTYASERGGIMAWLDHRPAFRERGLPWFWCFTEGFHRDAPFREPYVDALVALARWRDDEDDLVATVVQLAVTTTEGVFCARAGALLVQLAGLTVYGELDVVPFEALSPAQRGLAERLVDTTLFPLGGHGLPASGAVRRRWAGIDPAGPLERRVSVKSGKGELSGPLWQVWRELIKTGKRGSGAVPPPLDSALQGRERYEAIVEFDHRGYAFQCATQPAQLEEELAKLPPAAELAESAAALAERLVPRYEAARAQGIPYDMSFSQWAMVLLPLARAARPIDQRWLGLMRATRDEQVREVMEAVAPEQRERYLLSVADSVADPRWGRSARELEAVIALSELAPTARVGAAIVAAIGRIGDKSPIDGKACMDRFLEIARAHAQLRPALPNP